VALEVRKAGYQPALLGYTSTSADPRRQGPGDPALRSYAGVLPGMTPVTRPERHWRAWFADLKAKGYEMPENFLEIFRPPGEIAHAGATADGRGLTFAPARFLAEDSLSAFLTGEAIKYLSTCGRQPWFLHISYLAPHPPFVTPAPYHDLYAAADVPRPVRAANDDSLVVFTSDHGEQLGDHWQFAKYAYFDQSFHIPLIIRDPRPQADAVRGRQVDAFTENVDIMPTILDCLGLDIPAQCDGESLTPFCHDGDPGRWRDAAHWEFDFRDWIADGEDRFLGLAPDQCTMSVSRGERYKYVHFTGLPPLFFDLHEDPEELHDLADDPGHRSLVLEHTRGMLSWRMNHDERVLANTRLSGDGARTTNPSRY